MLSVGVVALSVVLVESALLRAPSDVGDGRGGKHPCVVVMRETEAACKGLSYGESSDDCNFALCYTGHLNRDRCTDIVTDGTPRNVMFPEALDKLKKNHDVKCD